MYKGLKLSKALWLSAFVVLLTACQTPLGVLQDTRNPALETTQCSPKPVHNVNQYDYLVYANIMIDSMVKNNKVQARLKQGRLSIYLQPVSNKSPDDIDVSAINYAIKNRVIRSGHFIVSNDPEKAQYQLSGVIKTIINTSSCDTGKRRFSLSLTRRDQSTLLWSEYKNLQ